MKVLLVNPNRERMPWPALPLGLCTVASGLAAAGHEVEVLDLMFAADPARETANRVRKCDPDVVGLSIRNIDNCNFEVPHFYLTDIRDQVVRSVRAASQRAKIVIGGSAVNVSPGDTFSFLEADYALVGEGEEALPEFLRALERGEPLARVPGVLEPGKGSTKALPILDTGRLARGEPPAGRALVHDFAQSPRSEAWRWVDLKQYAAHGSPYSIQTKRGCALKCSYCVYNNIEGHAYRLRDPVEVVDELQEAVTKHGVRAVDFVDSTFNLPLSHARAICEELERRPLVGVELSTMGLNPAGVTPELVDAMKRAGFKSVMCTPESASEVTLKTLRKGFQKHAVIRAAHALRDGGLPTYWFFMLGAPGETMETVRETLAFCEEHIAPSDMVLFSTGIRVYAGTPLERQCKDMGWFAEDDPLFLPSWFLSPELDLNELYSTLMAAAAVHPNWMTNAETVVSPAMNAMMKGAFKALGWKGPFWKHLPRLFGLANRIGVRQRGLEHHARNLRKVTDVRHYRG
ncbi:MAG TPA: radical SAM protein [Polyangiaceae bacterium]|nr:radical SAM protein [Polyangiaceae bacterium]